MRVNIEQANEFLALRYSYGAYKALFNSDTERYQFEWDQACRQAGRRVNWETGAKYAQAA
jgi:hypothetical protein